MDRLLVPKKKYKTTKRNNTLRTVGIIFLSMACIVGLSLLLCILL